MEKVTIGIYTGMRMVVKFVDLKEGPWQYRKHSEESILELADSIARGGGRPNHDDMVAIADVDEPGKYWIVCGHGRIAALGRNGHTEWLINVLDMDMKQAEEFALTDNVVRTNYTQDQMATAIFALYEKEYRKLPEIMEIFNVSKGTASNFKAAAIATDDIKELICDPNSRITVSYISAVKHLSDEKATEYIKLAHDQNQPRSWLEKRIADDGFGKQKAANKESPAQTVAPKSTPASEPKKQDNPESAPQPVEQEFKLTAGVATEKRKSGKHVLRSKACRRRKQSMQRPFRHNFGGVGRIIKKQNGGGCTMILEIPDEVQTAKAKARIGYAPLKSGR